MPLVYSTGKALKTDVERDGKMGRKRERKKETRWVEAWKNKRDAQ